MQLVILVEEQQWNYLTHSWGNKRVHAFTKGILVWKKLELHDWSSNLHTSRLKSGILAITL